MEMLPVRRKIADTLETISGVKVINQGTYMTGKPKMDIDISLDNKIYHIEIQVDDFQGQSVLKNLSSDLTTIGKRVPNHNAEDK